MTFGSLFAGIGGMDLGLERAGMVCKWQVEINDYATRVLEKHWPNVRRWRDVRDFPPKCNRCAAFLERFRCNSPDECDCPRCQGLCECDEWTVDLIAGGFPCQDISVAGNGIGIDGERSGLWREFYRVIHCLRPSYVIVENVPALLGRGLGRVLGDLAAIGFNAEWSLLSACSMGAPHTRERVFIIADSDEIGRRRSGFGAEREYEICSRFNAWETAPRGEWRDVERWIGEIVETGGGIIPASERGRMVDGVPNRLDRIGTTGNAVVPQVAEWIGRRIMEVAK